MKRLVLTFIFIMLCLFLVVFKGSAHAQQGTTQLDLSKIFDPRLSFLFPQNQTIPSYSYPIIQRPPLQLTTMTYPAIPTMPNYSFLFGNNWNMWQFYGLPFSRPSSKPKKEQPKSPKEETTLVSTQETIIDSNLKFSLAIQKTIYDKAELVKITIALANNGSEEVIVAFATEQKFDVIVKDEAEQIVRQLSDIQYDQPPTSLTLQPNDTETVYIQWDQENDDDMIVPSGTYTIEASLTAIDEKYQKTLSITISIKSLPKFSSCKKLKEPLKAFWEELKPSSPDTPDETGDGDDGSSEVLSEVYPPGPVRSPGLYGFGGLYGLGLYGLGGIYGMAGYGYQAAASGFGGGLATYAPSYSLTTFAPSLGFGIGAFAPVSGMGAFAPGLTGGFGLYSTGLGSPFSSLSYGSFTGYSSFGGAYSTGSIRWKTTREGLYGDMENSDYRYSTTNVQVAGVDEADDIKNDGTYIYMIKEKTVQIIQGSPVDSMEIVKEISLDGDFDLKRLYVTGNTLVLIGEQPVPVDIYYSTPLPGTIIFVYDITDRTNEILERKFIFGGAYAQSRRVGETLYVIMNEAAPLRRFEGGLTDIQALLPHFYDSLLHGDNEDQDEIMCDCDEVAYMPEYLAPNYLIVIGIPLNDHTKQIGREVILGKGSHVYATAEHLYVTSEYKNDLPTAVYKFWFKDETIIYGGNTQVDGKIIDQFSIDAYEGHLRIATISGSGSRSKNNIYIFDSGMKETGSIKDFTPGEGIQSIRFVDDRCYAVLSGDINSLSIISLTEPTGAPSLEFLDIFDGTYYYLHPFDKNRILGFGREIVGNAEKGMKISFFDFTDVSDPQTINEDVIGSHHTESEVLTDHRALLLDAEKNLMAFPVTVAGENDTSPYIFQGAYVYYIDEYGFEIIEGGITHHPQGTFPTSSYDSYVDPSPYHISRIIYMGDYYYAISESEITARDIQTHTETYSLPLVQ